MPLYANKGNRQVKIQDHEVEAYTGEGFTIVNEKGKRVAVPDNGTITIAEHKRALAEATKKGKTGELQAQLDGANKYIGELEAEVEALKDKLAAVEQADEVT